jgi:glycosyltransferase involved in cell wall biosynthesis
MQEAPSPAGDVSTRAGAPAADFSAVLPTYNRAAALRENLACFLALDGLAELIVVDDCSTDGASEFLHSVGDPRLRVIRHERNMGSPAARRSGIEAAGSDWVLMLEDDCRVPPDYGRVLLRVAAASGADIVGAPWVHAPADRLEEEVRLRRAHAVSRVGLRSSPGAFPRETIRTPFLPALVLARRDAFEVAEYGLEYRGNAWREETAFCVRAEQAGLVCLLTPETYSYQVDEWAGGQRRSRLAYEAWVLRNNWVFLRAHGAFLRRQGYIRSAVWEQLALLGSRVETIVTGRLRRLVG